MLSTYPMAYCYKCKVWCEVVIPSAGTDRSVAALGSCQLVPRLGRRRTLTSIPFFLSTQLIFVTCGKVQSTLLSMYDHMDVFYFFYENKE